MTDTDLIAQVDEVLALDSPSVTRRAKLVPALRDALAAALTRAELAECHAEALEEERGRLRAALDQIAETPARRFQRKIARAALTGKPQP